MKINTRGRLGNAIDPEIIQPDDEATELPVEEVTEYPSNEGDGPATDIVNDNFSQESIANISGLDEEEIKDPNKIKITIADKTSPIVVLFGPPACGKTMTLIRLTRYLKQKGFTVNPIKNFRPSSDRHYEKMCSGFNELVNQMEAAAQNSNISFMLVEVKDNNSKRTICQILEAPGELYFDPNRPKASFPAYVNAIKNSKNRKIWCYMVEPDWKNESDRMAYVDKIRSLKSNMRPKDKAVFIFNKIDLTQYVFSPGVVHKKFARKEVENQYPGIFVPFRSKGIIGTSDKFEFIPFQTGDYSVTQDGNKTFTVGVDEYPQLLWKTIMKLVRG